MSYEGKGKTFVDKGKELKKALSSPHPLHANQSINRRHINPPPQPSANGCSPD